MQGRFLFGIIGALMRMGTATASVIEVPGANDEMSGIYFFAGWKCAQGTMSGRIDGGTAFPLAGLIGRPDTASVCNDTNNGWIAQYNFNRLSQGNHTFQTFDGAASFASVTPSICRDRSNPELGGGNLHHYTGNCERNDWKSYRDIHDSE